MAMPKTKMCNYINWNYVFKLFLIPLGIIFFCEFLLYYMVLLKCSWPQLNEAFEDHASTLTEKHKPVKVMILTDTHLLGNREGHWFDKLRREWQMYRSFQTVMTIHNPDIVFFLGDLFDEGLWADSKEFQQYVDRFKSLFFTPEKTKVYVVVGNHDIGFHYITNRHLQERFTKAFNAPAVNAVNIEGNIFILINSIAMHGDGCDFCANAERKLKRISKRLFCDKVKHPKEDCEPFPDLPSNSKPILLQHIPLYRQSEIICSEPDSAPPWEKAMPHREKWECLSKDATYKLLHWLKPRVVFDGHVHHSCHVIHSGQIPEWTVASFSWRNKNNPSFLLAVFTPNNYAISKCYLPQESTVITIYIIGGIGLILWIIFTRRRLFKSGAYSKLS